MLDWAAGRTDTLILVTADHETGGLVVLDDNYPDYPSASWSTTGHTSANVPLYGWGVNADMIGGLMDNTDVFTLVRGADFDLDGTVDFDDLIDPVEGWEARFGVDLDGFNFLKWQRECETGVTPLAGFGPIPGPATIVLALIGTIVILMSRRTTVAQAMREESRSATQSVLKRKFSDTSWAG